MNLEALIADEWRFEVVAHGFQLWHGSQLAVDATIVFPRSLTRYRRGTLGHNTYTRALPRDPHGVLVLGTPLGTDE